MNAIAFLHAKKTRSAINPSQLMRSSRLVHGFKYCQTWRLYRGLIGDHSLEFSPTICSKCVFVWYNCTCLVSLIDILNDAFCFSHSMSVVNNKRWIKRIYIPGVQTLLCMKCVISRHYLAWNTWFPATILQQYKFYALSSTHIEVINIIFKGTHMTNTKRTVHTHTRSLQTAKQHSFYSIGKPYTAAQHSSIFTPEAECCPLQNLTYYVPLH